MSNINNFFRNRLQIIADYFKKTSAFIFTPTIINIIVVFDTVLGGILSVIKQNLYIFICMLMITICLLIINLIYVKRHSIRINNLYFEKDTFLINMITNILEVKRIKA